MFAELVTLACLVSLKLVSAFSWRYLCRSFPPPPTAAPLGSNRIFFKHHPLFPCHLVTLTNCICVWGEKNPKNKCLKSAMMRMFWTPVSLVSKRLGNFAARRLTFITGIAFQTGSSLSHLLLLWLLVFCFHLMWHLCLFPRNTPRPDAAIGFYLLFCHSTTSLCKHVFLEENRKQLLLKWSHPFFGHHSIKTCVNRVMFAHWEVGVNLFAQRPN